MHAYLLKTDSRRRYFTPRKILIKHVVSLKEIIIKVMF